MWRTCAVTPYGAATAATTSCSSGPTVVQTWASSIRRVPTAVPVAGMTLAAPPAWTDPHTSAAPARGSSRRERAAGTSVTTLASA